MRHLPERGQLISGSRGGAGVPIGVGATRPGGRRRGAHERRAETILVACFFFSFFYIMYSLLRYKNSHAALAMT